MQTKWYIRSLIVLLALLGLSMDQSHLANQQIVVAFDSEFVSQHTTQETITSVKEQLEASGAQNIQVREITGGTLVITYYSAYDTIAIKNMLSSAHDVALGYIPIKNTPKEQNTPVDDTSIYKIDVHELKQYSDVDSDLNGVVLEFEAKVHRYFVPDVYGSFFQIILLERNRIETVAYKINNHQSLGIDHFSYKIPEVRAGPLV